MKARESGKMRPAIVMNMFYTGLGIARTLHARGIPVIGLSAQKIYGNVTRCARVRRCPDSRDQPEELFRYLIDLAPTLPERGIIFPTRDADVLFLDRFRAELEAHYDLLLPAPAPLAICLNKWQTHLAAEEAGVASPRTWQINSQAELRNILPEVTFPCVLKPVFAYDWRKAGNWELVGCRKAVGVYGAQELIREYGHSARAEARALLQEMVPGGDDRLWIAACYVNREGKFAGGFTAQKLVQAPDVFGTGCVVQTVDRPELLRMAGNLLEKIGYNGVAEVEFKEDDDGSYKLIEINVRPWDQHRLGQMCGADVIAAAYDDLAGLPTQRLQQESAGQKWIAEDVYWHLALRALRKRDGRFAALRRLAKGPRAYAISDRSDPVPTAYYLLMGFLPALFSLGRHLLASGLQRLTNAGKRRGLPYDNALQKTKS